MRTKSEILGIILLIALSFAGMAILASGKTPTSIHKKIQTCSHVRYENKNFHNPTIIWNGDTEEMPRENSLIVLEYYSQDTIYIGSYEKDKHYNKD